MPWYKVLIRPEQEAELLAEYLDIFVNSGGPEDAALFCTGRFPLRIELRFSPEAGRLAKDLIVKYKGSECEIPSIVKAQLVCGDGSALRRLLLPPGGMN